ncbi:cytochrome C [Rhizobium leguminosarum bv. viciae]|uniref:cytochrome c n=1 Tax=Rhizobium TaxID=379 RepID=UPI00102FFEBA|nr:cytochrome c [Rhizobium leguminosarum]MBY5338971.1 cytochrome c [Rhizobium leguminosarum]NKK47871.1 cytochrome C [Rhizobium leguminosarum bv. viciae]TBG84764.1 cytochrome C [Rhizobium leguminosarum]TBZ00575.1 cytochrome C [Rhizobium leguminosarum bv. viciae]
MRLTADANKFGLLAFVAAVLMTAAMSSAAGDVVAIRQADMKAMAAAAKTISGMFKDPTTYKANEFKWAADTIRDRSGGVLSAHFASEADSRQSKAGPNILKERDRFDRIANDLRDYAVALDAAAQNNPGPMSASMRMKPGEVMGGGPLGTHVRNEQQLLAMPAEHTFHLMLQTCTTCHAKFRME